MSIYVKKENLSFFIEEGEYCFMLGETGSGKTTILELLMGFSDIDSKNTSDDKVEILSQNILDKKYRKEIQKKISYVFQKAESHFFKTKVEDELRISGDIEEGIEVLKKLNLNYDDIKDKSPFDLSGGEKRKVAIAIALLKKPKILLLDEPTTGLDGKSSYELMKFLKELNRDGLTIVQVTHVMEEVYNYATKVILIKDGSVTYEGVDIFSNEKLLYESKLEIPFEKKLLDTLVKNGLDVNRENLEEFVLEKIC